MAGTEGKIPQYSFREGIGKTVASIRYQEHDDWQALEVQFTDGTLFSFELNARVTVDATYLEQHRGNSEIIRKYGRLSDDTAHEP